MPGREPAAFLGDADGHDFILLLIDCVENRRSGEQRDFVLAAAPAKQNPDSKLLHGYSVWTGRPSRVNRRADSSGILCPLWLKIEPTTGYTEDYREILYRIFFPNADNASSTARSAVWLCSSITGFTSTISKLSMRP